MATPTTKQPPSLNTPTTPAKPKAGKFRRACRRIYKIITSHLGLIAFLVAFSFVGAAIFQAIEGDNEKDEKADIQYMREQVIQRVWNASAAVKRNENAFRLLMRLEMKKYEAQLYVAFGEGINTSTDTEVWDFWGSLFYCATVYTTIGYGNISPATDVGRVVTIIYSLIGIPLCLIVLADLGKLFTRIIKWMWSFVRRFYHTRRWSRAGAKKVTEEKAERARQATAVRQIGVKQSETARMQQSAYGTQQEIPAYVVDDEFNLPVSVAMIITFLYILLGALIYRQWEEWSYLEAFYFVFISVSTIGFGDVLPDHPKYFLLSSVYVLVGLSLVAMVINVIMEAMTVQLDVAQKNIAEIARTVGIGIVEDETDQANLNGSATKSTSTTTPGVTPRVTPAPSVSSLGAPISGSQVMTPTTPRDSYNTPLTTPAPRDDGYYGPSSQDNRGRAPYRDRPGEYQGRDAPDHRRGDPYDYRPNQDYRGRPDDYRGRPDDYRGRPDDYRGGPSDYRSPDPRGDPRIGDRSPDRRIGDRSPDRRMGDPRYGDPRADPRLADRGDPRFDPRSPTDPRGDPRLGDPGMTDHWNDPRTPSDPRGDPRNLRSPPGYGQQQSQGRPEYYVS